MQISFREHLGRLAYQEYCRMREGKSVSGQPLPPWEEQNEALREAWSRAAEAVRRELEIQAGPA